MLATSPPSSSAKSVMEGMKKIEHGGGGEEEG